MIEAPAPPGRGLTTWPERIARAKVAHLSEVTHLGDVYADTVVAKLIALVVPLGLDTFAMSASLGMLGAPRSQRLRLAAVYTAFEAGMPMIGLALGAPLGHAVGGAADYGAIALLIALGLYLLLASEDDAREERRLASLAGARGAAVLLLGLSVSLDELAIGFTVGLLRLPVELVIVLIAAQAFIVTQLGLRLGARLSDRLREAAERIAGLALAGLGAVLLAEKVISG